MTRNIITGTALTGLVLAGGFAGLVSAQTAAEATGLTEEQIIEIALTEVPGEVLEVEFDNEDGEAIYEVEVLAADGTEFEVEIDAQTGDVLEVEEDDDRDRKGRHDKDCDDDEGEDDDEDEAEDADTTSDA